MTRTHGRAPVPLGPTPQYPIESVDNALKIIHLLGARPELRLTEVAEALGVASSTAHRLLAMLQYRGFVRQDAASKTYRAGGALSSVSFAILQRFDVREAVRPLLRRLNEEFSETVHLATLDGAQVRFIDAIESTKAVRVALSRTLRIHPCVPSLSSTRRQSSYNLRTRMGRSRRWYSHSAG